MDKHHLIFRLFIITALLIDKALVDGVLKNEEMLSPTTAIYVPDAALANDIPTDGFIGDNRNRYYSNFSHFTNTQNPMKIGLRLVMEVPSAN